LGQMTHRLAMKMAWLSAVLAVAVLIGVGVQ
jgi:hypothetical protein